MYITKKHLSRRTVLKGMGATMALPLLEAMVPARTRARRAAADKKCASSRIEMVHGSAGSTAFGIKKNLWAPAAAGTAFDLSAERLSAARAVPRLPDHRQQHRRAQRRGVHRAGNRRRPLPLERGVPDPVAPEADAGLRRPRRHLARPDLRAEVRPGHADSVDAAVHRERRPGGRLLLRLLVRLHRLDQLGVADAAAADDSRSARWCSISCSASAPRRRSARERRAEDRSILDWLGDVDQPAEEGARRRRPRAPRATTSTTCARSSAASRRSRRYNSSGEPRELPGAPIGVPDSFAEHVKLMFDLQALAFAVGHHARLRVQAGPRRVEPRLSRRAASTARSTPRRTTASARTRSSTSRRSTGTTSAWCRTSSRS